MPIQNFLADYSFILVFVIVFVLAYAALKLLKIPGNNLVLALTSILISFLVASSTNSTDFLASTISSIAIIMVVAFFIVFAISFLIVKEETMNSFKKPLAVIAIILAIIMCIFFAFSNFHILNHLLPDSSNSGLSHGLVEIKDFVYSTNFKEFFLLALVLGLVCFFILKKEGK
jgi:hypothetical protein